MTITGQFIFVSVCLAIGFVFHTIANTMEHAVRKARYSREQRKFREAVARGETPDKCPMEIDERGVWRIDPNDLVHTAGFKRQVRALRDIMERARHEQIPGFETLYEDPRSK